MNSYPTLSIANANEMLILCICGETSVTLSFLCGTERDLRRSNLAFCLDFRTAGSFTDSFREPRASLLCHRFPRPPTVTRSAADFTFQTLSSFSARSNFVHFLPGCFSFFTHKLSTKLYSWALSLSSDRQIRTDVIHGGSLFESGKNLCCPISVLG